MFGSHCTSHSSQNLVFPLIFSAVRFFLLINNNNNNNIGFYRKNLLRVIVDKKTTQNKCILPSGPSGSFYFWPSGDIPAHLLIPLVFLRSSFSRENNNKLRNLSAPNHFPSVFFFNGILGSVYLFSVEMWHCHICSSYLAAIKSPIGTHIDVAVGCMCRHCDLLTPKGESFLMSFLILPTD